MKTHSGAVSDIIAEDGEKHTDSVTIASSLNNFCAQIAHILLKNTLPPPLEFKKPRSLASHYM